MPSPGLIYQDSGHNITCFMSHVSFRSDTWTRVSRADFVIIKIYHFDHAHIVPLFYVLVDQVLQTLYLNYQPLYDIFEGIKPLTKYTH